MTQRTENSITVNIPAAKLWAVLQDFGGIEKFAPTIKSSPIINDIHSGLGAKRRCTFNDGSDLVEEIIEIQEGKSFKMQLTELSSPMKTMQAEMGVRDLDANRCEIFMSTDFSVKGGMLGWLMGTVLIKPMMKGVFKKVMTGLAYHCETGEIVGEALPSKEALAHLMAR